MLYVRRHIMLYVTCGHVMLQKSGHDMGKITQPLPVVRVTVQVQHG